MFTLPVSQAGFPRWQLLKAYHVPFQHGRQGCSEPIGEEMPADDSEGCTHHYRCLTAQADGQESVEDLRQRIRGYVEASSARKVAREAGITVFVRGIRTP
jgi:hypothetical protein